MVQSRKKVVEASELLLEIGCEELPPLFLRELYHNGTNFLADYLQPKGVKVGKSDVYLTSRRIVYLLQGLTLDLEILEQEIQGPPWHIAFDEKGKPTVAAKGFAKKLGRPLKNLYSKNTLKGKYLCGKVRWKGDLRTLFQSALPDFILSLAGLYPRRMRWGEEQISFLRPIHWILCLLDEYPLRFTVGSVRSGVRTRGHRYASPGWISIRNPQDYFVKIKKSDVMLASPSDDSQDAGIRLSLQGEKTGRWWDWTESLQFEYEYPSVAEAQFPEKFNVLPSEVVRMVIQKQMHCVPELKGDETLTNRFTFIADGPKSDADLKIIRKGYEKLAVARLTDALYFYEKDLKKPLAERVDDLRGILFLEGFGSLYDKTQRLKQLANVVNQHLKEPVHAEILERAGQLCRADQATYMVREITDLEGVMGKIYALKSGESPEISQAVWESYLPKGALDRVPKTTPGIVLSLADKIDNLLCYFSTDIRPSGTRDPLGFRRNVMGILRILDENRMDFPLRKCLENCSATVQIGANKIPEIKFFFNQRLENYLRESAPPHRYNFGKYPGEYQGALHANQLEHDVVQAALAHGFENPYYAIRSGVFLQVLKNSFLKGNMPLFGNLVRVGVRIHNIYLQGLSFDVVPSLDLAYDRDFYVHKVYQIYQSLNEERQKFLKCSPDDDSFYRYFCAFTSDRLQMMDTFFDKVLVMHEDPRIRSNRIALLGLLDECFQAFGDLTKIVIEKYE